MTLEIKGFEATAIGSLPFNNTTRALQLIKDTIPLIPHWPQLPNRGVQEHFVFQNLDFLVQLGLLNINDDKVMMDYESPNWVKNQVSFYELYFQIESGNMNVLEDIKMPINAAPGFYDFLDWIDKGNFTDSIAYKGQIAGPLSVGLFLKDHKKKLVYYTDQTRDIIVKAIMINAMWQAYELRKRGKQTIIFVDDPAVGAYGTSNYLTLNRQGIVDDLASIVDGVHKMGAIVGAHSCCNIDWTIFMDAGFDIINFDTGYFQSLAVYKDELISFVDKGGILAWGVVPTYNLSQQENVKNLQNEFEGQIDQLLRKGLNESKLKKQILLSPACGTGILTDEQAEKIYQLVAELAEIYNKY
ncbi:MAG: hypothetical protein APF76_05520 [Desulfitibacter sp. BRH_c19]|nr:MAG: hypothetical protein APF76_05520 [Desulfitibacter sp. BRH_c19]